MEAHALAARTNPDPANIEEGRGFKVNPPDIPLVPDPGPALASYKKNENPKASPQIFYEFLNPYPRTWIFFWGGGGVDKNMAKIF